MWGRTRRPLTVAGLCLAILSLGVTVPAVAAASTPEFKLCAKAQPTKSGKYSNDTCSESTYVGGGGQRFEREAFPFAQRQETWVH